MLVLQFTRIETKATSGATTEKITDLVNHVQGVESAGTASTIETNYKTAQRMGAASSNDQGRLNMT